MSNSKIDVIQDKTFNTIQSAINKMVDFIRPTFGPAGNKVIIDKFPYKMVVDDGVQIARDFELPDPAEQAVVRIVKETAIRTNDRAGDGTTGALIMLQAIINEIARRRNVNGRALSLELKNGLDEAVTQLKKSAKKITSHADLKKAALISFDNEKIATMIADLYTKLGKDGVITIDNSPTMETMPVLSDGITLNRGYISPYMINNSQRMETVIEKPYILLTDYRITEDADVFPILEKMIKAKKNGLVIIADNVEHNALSTLVINLPHVINPHTKNPGVMSSVAINIPDFGTDRSVGLEDLALILGAKVFTSSKGDKLENAEISDLGRAEKFIARKDESIIVGPKGGKTERAMAISSLKKLIEDEKDESKKSGYVNRLALFTNTMAVIKVGAPTENERKALKYKIEDVVHSVKSAYQHGVVRGGGLALAQLNISSPILNEALKYPARQLCENMGFNYDAEYLNEKDSWNLVTGERGNFMDVGVMDSVDVLIAGIESAVSIASLLITSSGIIVESEKENKSNG